MARRDGPKNWLKTASGTNQKQPSARLLLECLRHREADVLRFLSDTAIPSLSSVAPSPETPGYHPSRPAPEPRPKPVTHSDSAVTQHWSPAT
jgi:hypothetical protein